MPLHFLLRSSHAVLVSSLSKAPGTEKGIFEFDIPGGGYTIASTRRTYGTLIFSSNASAASQVYASSAASALTINGDFIINGSVTINLDLTGSTIIYGNYIQKGGVFNFASQPNSNTIFIKGDFTQTAGSIKMTEKGLEQKIIDNLQMFLLELGKGFAFVARQFKIAIRNKHYSIDLVFYHRILKCFVLIDLKIRKVDHGDIGQMNLYLNYFKTEENMEGDNEPIDIILSAEKDEVLVEFAMGGISNKIFISKYQLYLPDKKDLQKEVKAIMKTKPPKPSQKKKKVLKIK